MKKFSVLLTLAVLMVSSSVFAGSIDYLGNQSAKYLISLAGSNARTDAADIVAYNPAGTALMGEGFFIDVSNQTLFKPYSQDMKIDGSFNDSSEQSTPTLLLPNVYAVYNAGQIGVGKLAGYAQIGVTAGGGTLEWGNGAAALLAKFQTNALITSVDKIDTKVIGSSVYYDFGAGAAYSFLDDMVSVSAGAKYIIAKRSAEFDGELDVTSIIGAVTIDLDVAYDYDAAGYTPVFGIDVKPMKELTIGLRYEMETDLKFEYDVTRTKTTNSLDLGLINDTVNDEYAAYDGEKFNQNLPQIVGIGAEYVVNPELTVSAGAQIYFIGDADMEGAEDNYGTGWEASIGAIYKVMEPLKVGASFLYTAQAAKSELLEDEANIAVSANPVLDSLFFGIGGIYTVIPNLDVTLALGWVHYLPEDAEIELSNGDTLEVTYEKDIYNIAIGASYKI